MTREPTPEQQAILDSSGRVRVVRAAPGSGKTWLVAEVIRRKLDQWTSRTSGIAALSFTRVAGEEIRKAVGYDLNHPHFVGTLDAFLFRFVVRPFLHLCYPAFGYPRLVPGEWEPGEWDKFGPNQHATVAKGINVFGCVFVDEDQDRPVLAHKKRFAQQLERLSGATLEQAREKKKEIWKRTGRLTHSDVDYLSSSLLTHKTHGSVIRGEIVRRFPFLIVDELQDTGYFLGKSLLALLSEEALRGVLVGDPDQAIYEFNGARPDLFHRFESVPGAAPLPLSQTRRCPAAVARVAGYLKDTGGAIAPALDKSGRAYLLSYGDLEADVKRVVDAVTRVRENVNIKVIARSSSTVDDLTKRSTKVAPTLYCPALTHMQRAVELFRKGRQVGALAASRSAIDVAVFGHEGVHDEQLIKSKVDPEGWRTLAIESLFGADGVPLNGTLYEWQTAVGKVLDEKLQLFGLPDSLKWAQGRLKPQKREGWDHPVTHYLPQPGAQRENHSDVPVSTVHGVKGETHDVTILVCPNASAAKCPSAVWWSEKEKDREEKRIAYVAMTRTQGDLILCVSHASLGRLSSKRPEFVAGFECMTVDEFTRMMGKSSEPAQEVASGVMGN